MTEQVLVVSAGAYGVFAATGGQRFIPFPNGSQWEMLAKADPRFVDRDKAETDETTLQLIPYVVVAESLTVLDCCPPSYVPTGRVLAYLRAGGDGRLVGSWSCGVGGHIETRDGLPWKGENPARELEYTALVAAQRELFEEFGLSRGTIHWRGLLYSDESPVSRGFSRASSDCPGLGSR